MKLISAQNWLQRKMYGPRKQLISGARKRPLPSSKTKLLFYLRAFIKTSRYFLFWNFSFSVCWIYHFVSWNNGTNQESLGSEGEKIWPRLMVYQSSTARTGLSSTILLLKPGNYRLVKTAENCTEIDRLSGHGWMLALEREKVLVENEIGGYALFEGKLVGVSNKSSQKLSPYYSRRVTGLK